jgi:hypothetical protein
MRTLEPGGKKKKKSYRDWHVPLACCRKTLRECERELAEHAVRPSEIPWLIQVVENPKFDLPGFDLFHGAVDLKTHDRIHILLGRGLLPKDEAFVIGFTMGSTDRVSATEEALYAFFSRHLYPKKYQFSDSDVRVFRDAVRLGFISDCRSLSQVDYEPLLDLPLEEVRKRLGVEEDLLRAYYRIEKNRYAESRESQRLLEDGDHG